MKMKHNKKRNTAFLYESLIKELTKTIVKKQENTKNEIILILKEFFHNKSILKKDLICYEMILESKNLTKEQSTRLSEEVKKDYLRIDRKEVFNTQTKLIKKINESLSNEVFANFISNYKNLATVGQYFQSDKYDSKARILLEDRVVGLMTSFDKDKKPLQHVDNLTYNTFVSKFNNTYNNSLRTEQKDLLTNYITSFSDNGLGLKSFLNEEVGRLKSNIKEMMRESGYRDKLKLVYEKLESFKENPINEQMIKDVFYIQNLVQEVNGNGS